MNRHTQDRKSAHSKQQLLKPHEEKEVVKKVLEYDKRGMPPKHKIVGKMVAVVLQHGEIPANPAPSHNRVTRFVKRHDEIKTKVAYPMDHNQILAIHQKKKRNISISYMILFLDIRFNQRISGIMIKQDGQ